MEKNAFTIIRQEVLKIGYDIVSRNSIRDINPKFQCKYGGRIRGKTSNEINA